ncbi:MAG: WYL domain-containing protein [Ruminococcus sp.]|nr:WYL domain-containing protein [Ruminococcus sp.]
MLFSEIYGSYFNVVAKIIEESLNNTLSDKRLYEIVNEKGFAESVMNIPNSLKSGEWGIMTSDLKTPIKNKPEMPLTTLQKRWLKALINDPRIKLFDISASDLNDVEPLYTNDMFEYFDKYSDGDDFENPDYIKNFRTIISAIKSKNKLVVRFISRHGKGCAVCVIPHRLEYSQKDDKFRLISVDSRNTYIINLSRITSCSIAGKYNANEDREEQRNIKTLVLNLTDDRMALERFMHHFSYLKKQTEQLSTKEYRITIEYDMEDETEILIRILSFGPLIRVVSPKSFIEKLKSRINKQISCELF